MSHHLSAIALATIANALSEEVKDSDERAAVVEKIGAIIPDSEYHNFRVMCGLPGVK